MELRPATALIFDFDGVIVESNLIKSQAMARIFAADPCHASEILALNERLAGMSRTVKFEEIYKTILNRSVTPEKLKAHAEEFRDLVFDAVVSCPWVPGAIEFLRKHAGKRPIFLLSGTPDGELQEVVDARDIRGLFFEVYGSPPTKPETVRNILAKHGLASHDVVLIGDAPLDQQAAVATEVGFVGRLPSGEPSPFLPGTHTIPDLTQLEVALADAVNAGRLEKGSAKP